MHGGHLGERAGGGDVHADRALAAAPVEAVRRRRQWRLATAARPLRDSDAPLSAVAAQVGYASQYAFANAFKREYGISPGRYRTS